MEQLQTITTRIGEFFHIPADVIFLENTLHAYMFSFIVFLFALAICGLAQYFLLSWLASLSKRTATDLDDAFVKMARSLQPPFYVFASFWFALRFIDISGVADGIVTAILVLWIVYQAVIIVGILVEEVVFRHLAHDQDETTKSALHLLANLAKGVMWVIGLLLVLSNFGINVTSLMAGAGIAGIAIAFALQGILSDLFSSFSLYFDKPFKVGDFIIVGESMGVVKHIGIKSTRIQALSGEEVSLSNQELTRSRIRNFKRMDERRVAFTLGVLYETPAETVKRIPSLIQGAIEAVEGVRFDRAHFKTFADSALEFEVIYYVLSSDYAVYMDIQQNINLNIMERFQAENIEFAYPTRTVHLVK